MEAEEDVCSILENCVVHSEHRALQESWGGKGLNQNLENYLGKILLHRGVSTSSSRPGMENTLYFLWQSHGLEHYFGGDSEAKIEP